MRTITLFGGLNIAIWMFAYNFISYLSSQRSLNNAC